MASESPRSTPTECHSSHLDRKRSSKTTRVRTGCVTCRNRRKKCDEAKPGCLNCMKANIICEGYRKRIHWGSTLAGKKAMSAKLPYLPVATVGDVEFNATSSFALYEVFQGVTPINFDPNLGGLGQQKLENDWEIVHKSPKEMPRDYSYIPWQFDGLSTDLQNNSSVSPTQVALKGHPHVSSHQLTLVTGRQAYISMELPCLIPGLEKDIHRSLFYHFHDILSLRLTTSNDKLNPLNRAVIPLALQDRNIMITILSLAGLHLSNLRRHFELENDLTTEVLQLHKESVQLQAGRMKSFREYSSSTPYLVQDQNIILASSLLLLLYEICEGMADNSTMMCLDMGREVLMTGALNHDSQQLISTATDSFLLQFFLYHDSLASVTMPHSASSKPRFYPTSTSSLSDNESDPFMLMGLKGLNDLIIRISCLRDFATSRPLQPDSFITRTAVSIEEDLRNWRPASGLHQGYNVVAMCYKKALFIWLYSIVYPDAQEHEMIQNLVEEVINEMKKIADGDGVMACLLFPLFVIGAAAVRIEDRVEITAQFQRLRNFSALRNIDLTQRVVQGMWGDHDRGLTRSWHWNRQLEPCNTSLLVA